MINVNLASKVRKGTLHWCVYIATPSSKLSKLPRDKNGGGGGSVLPLLKHLWVPVESICRVLKECRFFLC